MNIKKAKFIMLALAFIFIFFFSSDFGLIDVEKTSIITAFAIDMEKEQYIVSAQIAVPEATDTNSEDQKALLTGKGSTIGGAVKDLGDISGWFPKLSFCNLILVGEEFKETNVITVLDYFAKTLRLQDSALVAFTEGKASELLQVASPLDNISSFAMQKVLLKTDGFDADVAVNDIKTFCAGYYSECSSSIMPIIKKMPSDENQNESGQNSSSSGGGSSGEMGGSSSGSEQSSSKTNGKFLFDAKTTALFKNGVKVGELDEELTLTYNALTQKINGTTIPVNDVPYKDEETCNYLLSVMSSKRKISLEVDNNNPTLNIELELYCKINDQNSEASDRTLSENLPLPQPLVDKATEKIKTNIIELVEASIKTNCDFLKIKEKLYRFNHKEYSRFKDNVLQAMETNIKVTVSGQK